MKSRKLNVPTSRKTMIALDAVRKAVQAVRDLNEPEAQLKAAYIALAAMNSNVAGTCQKIDDRVGISGNSTLELLNTLHDRLEALNVYASAGFPFFNPSNLEAARFHFLEPFKPLSEMKHLIHKDEAICLKCGERYNVKDPEAAAKHAGPSHVRLVNVDFSDPAVIGLTEPDNDLIKKNMRKLGEDMALDIITKILIGEPMVQASSSFEKRRASCTIKEHMVKRSSDLRESLQNAGDFEGVRVMDLLLSVLNNE